MSALVLDPLYLTLIIPFNFFSLLSRDILEGHQISSQRGGGWGSHLINFHLYELKCAAELLALELMTTGCVSSKRPIELRPLLRKTARMSKRISEDLECTRFLPTQHPLRYFCVESMPSASLVKPDIDDISSVLNSSQFLAHRCSPVSFSHD